jgi:hypothetical protein
MLKECPECGFEIVVPEDPLTDRICSRCGTLIVKAGEHLAPKSETTKPIREPGHNAYKTVAFGFIIVLLIVSVTPWGVFGFFGRVLTTMGNGLPVCPICGGPAEAIQYRVEKGGIDQGRTEIRWFCDIDAPSHISEFGDITGSLFLRSLTILFLTFIMPLISLIMAIRENNNTPLMKEEIQVAFISFIVGEIFLVIPLLQRLI